MSLSRRQFLQGTIAVAGIHALSTVTKAQALSGRRAPEDEVYDCIILGAGPAGLTAARQLSRARLRGKPLKLLVLEGSARFGGRMHTNRARVDDFGASVEVGADYIHVERDMAPIWNDVDRYNIRTRKLNKYGTGYIYHPRELPEGPQTALQALKNLHFGIIQGQKIFWDLQRYGGADLSAAAFIRRMGYRGFAADTADTIFAGHLPGSLEKLSVHAFKNDHIAAQLQNRYDHAVNGGFDSLLQAMIAEVGVENILYNQRVTRVRRGVETGTIQAYVEGAGWLTGRSLLCTVSIGALHAHVIDFGEFWTEEKERCLRFIMPGPETKVLIRFDDRFWPADATLLSHLQPAIRNAGRTYYFPNRDNPGKPPLISALIGGDQAVKFRSYSNEHVLRLICADLDQMFPRAAPSYSRVTRRGDGSLVYLRKQWSDDAYSRGGISYVRTHDPVGAINVRSARRALASSRETKPLFWAGEATQFEIQPASVHGAHASGLRAAKEIYKYLRLPHREVAALLRPTASDAASDKFNSSRLGITHSV